MRIRNPGCSFDDGRVVRDGFTYNGMRVVGDGAADPLDLHQDQNKRHHSQRPRQHHKSPAKSINIRIKIKTLQGFFFLNCFITKNYIGNSPDSLIENKLASQGCT